MIEARGLTKFYGERAAVSNLSFTVRPGVVTGFLGPNGSFSASTPPPRVACGSTAATTPTTRPR
jgi:ABC-type lipopolysaccharide export system ATPase subunit